jgi:hypothetical protein
MIVFKFTVLDLRQRRNIILIIIAVRKMKTIVITRTSVSVSPFSLRLAIWTITRPLSGLVPGNWDIHEDRAFTDRIDIATSMHLSCCRSRNFASLSLGAL